MRGSGPCRAMRGSGAMRRTAGHDKVGSVRASKFVRGSRALYYMVCSRYGHLVNYGLDSVLLRISVNGSWAVGHLAPFLRWQEAKVQGRDATEPEKAMTNQESKTQEWAQGPKEGRNLKARRAGIRGSAEML